MGSVIKLKKSGHHFNHKRLKIKSTIMDKDPLDDLAGKTIQDLLNETNPKFYLFLKDVLKLNRIRTVELCTYL